MFEAVLIFLSIGGLGYVAWSVTTQRAVASGYDVASGRPRRPGTDSMFSLSRSVLPAPAPVDLPAPRSEAPTSEARPTPDVRPVPASVTRMELEIGQDEDGHHEFEIIELREGDDVLSLEFTEDRTSHLHLVNGRAEAEIDGRKMQTAWLDVYLSKSRVLSPGELDESGEYPPTRATHVLRVDLGSTRTTADGLTTGDINESPDLVFDRAIATETSFHA